MSDTYDLARLDPTTFEHMVNALVLAVLGNGATGFSPGPDGGRDGYFEGEAPYPSVSNRWSGVWYIQSKLHKPHISTDCQKWLLKNIQEEIDAFTQPESKRKWPTNWIIATNIDPSGTPETGAFDKAKDIINSARPSLSDRFHIWGGAKIIALLAANQHVARKYAHFLTPGDVLAEIVSQLSDERADSTAVLQQLIVRKFKEEKLTKLEQAGSQSESKPAIHDLFVDLPFRSREHNIESDVMRNFTAAGNETHIPDADGPDGAGWRLWTRQPQRAKTWFVRGGPGQGKSTIGQFYCQIQRAALILNNHAQSVRTLTTHQSEVETAYDVRAKAIEAGFWPTVPRIPINVELKDYAQWFGNRKENQTPKGILTYVAESLSATIEQPVTVGILKRALAHRAWIAVFDGLDEVPDDVKDQVASEVVLFVTQIALELSCDLLSLCTSRPQGYSGQFRDLGGVAVDLLLLPTDRALACARPVIAFQRSNEESQNAIALLEASATSPSIRELLTTPLQAHILAIVVRDGERPPDRRWKLYARFYDVIRRREANRNLPDRAIAHLLRIEEKLLKTLHNRVGFRLQADAETSRGAETSLDKESFRELATRTVSQMLEDNVEVKVATLQRATTERLVLINTPESGTKLRFDIRQLQEFFAAECLYDSVKADELGRRISLIAADAHWREVIYFLLSSLVENDRSTELSVAIEALVRLDEGDDDLRLLHRRVAKGALLAARLLREGVLEQDKAVRQSFRHCLEPLAAFTSPSRLVDLMSVRQTNSKTWLIAFLLERIRNLAPAENIGASIILIHLLPDGHHGVPVIQKHLENVSASYLGSTISSVFGGAAVDSNNVPQWFLHVVINTLCRPDWAGIGEAAITLAAWLLKRVENGGCGALDDSLIPFAHLLFIGWMEEPQNVVTIGNIKFTCMVADIGDQAVSDLNVERRDVPGIFGFIRDVLGFQQLATRESYCNILSQIDIAGRELLSALLRETAFPMPRIPLGETLVSINEKISKMDDDQFTTYIEDLRQLRLGAFEFWDIDYDSPVTLETLLECYRCSPSVALEVVCIIDRGSGPGFSELNTVEQFISAVLNDLRENPLPLLALTWGWHRLLGIARSNAHVIKELIFYACRRSLPHRRETSRRALFEEYVQDSLLDCLIPFVELTEPAVLPFLADLVFCNIRMQTRIGGYQIKLPFDRVPGLGAFRLRLLNIAADSLQCWSVRCSAALFHLTSANTETDSAAIDCVYDLLISNCNSREGAWLLDGVVESLLLIGRIQTETTTSLVQDLFESCREDYKARGALERILELWRESSNAPVTRSHLRDRWLYRDE